MLIDFHYHFADSAGALDELLKDMDASGVEKTLLMGGPDGGVVGVQEMRLRSQ